MTEIYAEDSSGSPQDSALSSYSVARPAREILDNLDVANEFLVDHRRGLAVAAATSVETLNHPPGLGRGVQSRHLRALVLGLAALLSLVIGLAAACLSLVTVPTARDGSRGRSDATGTVPALRLAVVTMLHRLTTAGRRLSWEWSGQDSSIATLAGQKSVRSRKGLQLVRGPSKWPTSFPSRDDAPSARTMARGPAAGATVCRARALSLVQGLHGQGTDLAHYLDIRAVAWL
ncbi:MAG: hypothetical protein JWO67_1320 [Streptosporangiaceae bacterium]|nr:hypothetical protein [Streptosporangiaceae bacterium]